LKLSKIDESYTVIEGTPQELKKIYEFLKVERPGAYFDAMVKRGFKSPYDHFSVPQDGKLYVMNGHADLLSSFGFSPAPRITEFSSEHITEHFNIIKEKFPFPPYDFQVTAAYESLLYGKQINRMCTGSGKSLTISLIAEFMRLNNKKGLLLVPNINLLTQFKNDIKDYNLIDLYDNTHVIGGGNTDKHFNCTLTISTWQSLLRRDGLNLNELDYVITDEAHRFASEETSAIVSETKNCKFKWGFTGTLPEDPVQKMQLLGLFGMPKTYVTSRQLIDRGLATPIKINSIVFNYNRDDKNIFKESGNYSKQLKFIKDHEKRNEFIIKLIAKIQSKGNTLCLFQHTDHGKGLFIDTMKRLYPDVPVENKDITGKKSFEFQEQYGVYFLNGEDDAKTRERTRKILEEDFFVITMDDDTLIRLNGNEEVLLIDGTQKIVKDLTENDEIDDDFLNLYKVSKE
jgi:superfamily II DNA or RNA helicase